MRGPEGTFQESGWGLKERPSSCNGSAEMRMRFDRGTVLFEDPPQGVDLAGLPGVLWDPRVRAFRAPAFRHRELLEDLRNRQIPVTDAVRNPETVAGAWSPFELRPYQEAALLAWELAGRRGLIALPTGSGKTQVALAAMARTGLSTLCLVPTRVLLDQWQRRLAQAYAGCVGCFGDGERQLASITVATFESAYRQMDVLGNRFELLVVDEAHHFGIGFRDEALEMCAAPCRLGLSATPPRRETSASRRGELVGPIVYHLAIGDLAGRFLSRFELITITLDLGREEREAYKQDTAVCRAALDQFRRLAPPEADWQDFIRAC